MGDTRPWMAAFLAVAAQAPAGRASGGLWQPDVDDVVALKTYI